MSRDCRFLLDLDPQLLFPGKTPLWSHKVGRMGTPLVLWEKQKKALKNIKRALTGIPAVGFPGVMKPFFLCAHERLGTAVGVLTQLLGSWHCLMAYLSKQLDAASWGWLPCLHTLPATAVLMAEADKLTLGQELTVQVPPLCFDSHEI
jgi:hypothetical protein